MNITKIIMNHLSLDELVKFLPRTKGRFIIYINSNVTKKAEEYFEYDKYRLEPHPHFIAYGKDFFDISYIGHYLLPYIETTVRPNYETLDLILQYEIK